MEVLTQLVYAGRYFEALTKPLDVISQIMNSLASLRSPMIQIFKSDGGHEWPLWKENCSLIDCCKKPNIHSFFVYFCQLLKNILLFRKNVLLK